MSHTILDLADMQFHGTATAEDMAALEAMLTKNPENQAVYLRYALLHGQLGLTSPAMPQLGPWELNFQVERSEPVPTPGRRSPVRLIAAMMLVVAASVLLMIWFQFGSSPNPGLPTVPLANKQPGTAPEPTTLNYDNRTLPMGTVGQLGQADSGPTTLTVERGEARFASSGGAKVRLTGPAMFGVNSRESGVLFNGSVHAKLDKRDAKFSVLASNLRVVDLGTEFQVDQLDEQHIRVSVFDGQVDVQSRVRRPLYYWHFDTPNEANLMVGASVSQVKGIVGNGAMRFDNSPQSFIQINQGTGEKVGTGEMAFSSGISVEAMFVSEWTASHGDYDEIFRKEDGVNRILLSFQHDGDVGDYDFPEVTPGPCLSFGCHVEQHGYSELDMPLDGQEGRPRVEDLTDGRPHHVVATYDSFSGKKTIYLDGRLCFQHTFPVGRLLLSGGPSPAVIGNMWNRREAFQGVIDEVALYDFALTPEEIAAHHQHVLQGNGYFGNQSHQQTARHWESVTLIPAGSHRIFNKLTGLPKDDAIQ